MKPHHEGRRTGARGTPADRVGVLLPVKAFDQAKARLAPVLDAAAREALARRMAERVLAAAHELPVTVACDDERVSDWARRAGAAVVWTEGLDLNGAVGAGVLVLRDAGTDRVIVAHADLPGAADLRVAATGDGVVAVTDRRRDGTNVLAVPAACGFRFAYGPGSFERHRAEAAWLGLRFTELDAPDLAHDVDGPDDLDAELAAELETGIGGPER